MATEESRLYDVIIIGAASAGLTAAVYTARQGMKTLVVSKDMGGQALLTNEIQNYPGFINIGGFELMSKFEEQAKVFGANFVYDEVTTIENGKDSCFTVKTPNHEFNAPALILAFGKTPRDLGVPGEQKFKGRGVSYCAVCDGPLYKGRPIAIAGSGDPALDATDLLSGLAGQVYLINRWDRPIGDEETIERLKAKPNVKFILNTAVTEIKGSATVASLGLKNLKDNSIFELPIEGLFIEMGYVAKTDFVKDLVELNATKEITVDAYCATSHQGVFAAGDVTQVPFKQAVISAGQGSIAALSAINYLMKLRGKPLVKADWKSVAQAKPIQT